jgi:hypothetical protein
MSSSFSSRSSSVRRRVVALGPPALTPRPLGYSVGSLALVADSFHMLNVRVLCMRHCGAQLTRRRMS